MMEDHQHVPPAGADHLARYQKLKATCDMCSSSKVRCDRTKPVCGRCSRLRYPCFYSPARRARRRRRLQTPSLSDSRAVAGKSPKAASPPTTAAGDKSVPADSTASDDAAESSFRPAFGGANPFPTTHSHSSTLSSNDDNNNGDSTEALPSALGDGPPRDSESDCVTVAADILRHLQTSRSDITLARPTASGGLLNPPTLLDISIRSTSLAIKRVSTILICPCSQNPDVGLLAAAICAALLDYYEAILRDDDPAGPPAAAAGFSSSSPPSSEHNRQRRRRRIREAEGMEIGGGKKHEIVMPILEELPKVAKIITQFMKRYGDDDVERCSSGGDMLRALAAEMMTRLRAMVDEATSWVVRI